MKREDYFETLLVLQDTKNISDISMRDIANELSVSTGSIYYEFTNKNELLNATYIYYKKRIVDFMSNQNGDVYKIFKLFIKYNIYHNSQYKFCFASEMSDFITEESIDFSHQMNAKLFENINIDYHQNQEKVAIVMGTMVSYLLAPEHYNDVNEELLINELVNVIDMQ